MKEEKIIKEYFDKLAEILEKEFPKKRCKERGHALVLNSYANFYLGEALQAQKRELLKIVKNVLFEKYLEYDDTERALKEIKKEFLKEVWRKKLKLG